MCSLWGQILSFKRSSYFEKGHNCRDSLLDTVVSLSCAYFFQRSGYAIAMGQPTFIVTNKMGESISIQRVNIHVRHRVPTEVQKLNSMIFIIFHDQQCNFHEYLMLGLVPLLLNVECNKISVFK